MDEQAVSIFVTIIGVFSFIVNGALLVVLLKDPLKFFKTTTTYFIISLAVADMITGVNACAFGIEYFYPYPVIYERYLFSLFWITVQASFLTLLAMSMERFIVVKYPFRCRAWITKNRVYLSIAVIWLISVLLGGLVLLPERQVLYVQFSIFSEFFVSVFIIIILYAFIIHGLRSSHKSLKNIQERKNRELYEYRCNSTCSGCFSFKTKSICQISTVGPVVNGKRSRKKYGICSTKSTDMNANNFRSANGDVWSQETGRVSRSTRISTSSNSSSRKTMRKQSSLTRHLLRNSKQQQKLTFVVFLLGGVLVLTVLPYILVSQIYIGYLIFCECQPPWQWFAPFIKIYFPIELLNFAVNPLIYAWRLPQYRKTLKHLWSRRENVSTKGLAPHNTDNGGLSGSKC